MAAYEDYAGRINPRSKLKQMLDEVNRGTEVHLRKIAEELINLDQLTAELSLSHIMLLDIQASRAKPYLQRYVSQR